MKSSEIKGVIRTREMEHIAGDDVSETIHHEYGCRLLMDVKNVYFSPRLATERRKVADNVQDGDIMLDMFAGVGPFSILIAREKSVKIYAVDINPAAYAYLQKNIELNKVQDKIIPLLGDVAQIVNLEKIKADRIIMNLPGSAWEFLGVAMDALRNGGVIHYYEFSSDYDNAIKRLKDAANPREIKVLAKRKVKSRSPGQWHIVVDAKVF
jgi:tRNA (guanine37-N1)-methyltransferase